MLSEDAEVITGFLAGEGVAVETVDGWIRRAASSYRRRLGVAWGDVLQDLRLEITQLLREEKFRGRSSLKTYVYRVVSHTCLNHIRSAQRWQWTELEEVESKYGGLGSGQGGQLERVLGARESRDLLLRVWQEMSAECRDLWSMIFEGRSYEEMSRRLGVSQGALRVRVVRCRKKAVEFRRRSLEGQDSQGGR